MQTITMPDVPMPDELSRDLVERRRSIVRYVPPDRGHRRARDGSRPIGGVDEGRPTASVIRPIRTPQLLHRCWLAYLSDDLPTDAVSERTRWADDLEAREALFCASLDHTIWFHAPAERRPVAPARLLLRHFVGGRGSGARSRVRDDGTHVATVAQEVLLRDSRNRPLDPGGRPGARVRPSAQVGQSAGRSTFTGTVGLVTTDADLPDSRRFSIGSERTCWSTR